MWECSRGDKTTVLRFRERDQEHIRATPSCKKPDALNLLTDSHRRLHRHGDGGTLTSTDSTGILRFKRTLKSPKSPLLKVNG